MSFIIIEHCPCCGSTAIQKELTAKDYTVTQQEFDIYECQECRLRFTQCIPDENSIGDYYKSDNYISHSDTKAGFINRLYHKVRRRTMIRKYELITEMTGKTCGRLLDVGAGTGAFLHHMQQYNWDVTGLEPDETTRNKAQELYNIVLENNTILYNLPEQAFDAITLWHVLEHVHDLHRYIEQLRKLLKPDGKLFIAVPNYTSYDAEKYGKYWAAYDVPRHLYHFSPLSMQTLLPQHGLKIEQMLPMWYDSFYISLLSEEYKYGGINKVNAFLSGLRSNMNALNKPENCSSVIYVASHK